MRRITLFTLLALAGTVPSVLPVAPPLVHAAEEEALDQARKLVEEARPFFQASGNPDLSRSERKKQRREAYSRLSEARRLYDVYLDANPDRVEALDAEYCDCNALMFWCRKMASVGELDDVPRHDAPPPGDESEDDSEDTGGIGGTSTRPPKDDAEEPETPPDAEPESTPEPEDPRVELERRSREAFEQLERRLAERPGDVAALYEEYERFLAEFDDSTLPEYGKAAMRLGSLADRMKTVFKEELQEDPDGLDDADSKTVTHAVSRLTRAMKSSDVELRRSTAAILGGLRTGAASFALVEALDDEDDEVRRLAFEGLVATGGPRVGYNVTKVYANSRVLQSQVTAVEVLAGIAAKGPVDAKVITPFLGRFVLSRDETVVDQALDALRGLGRTAGPGLVEALETRNYLKRIAVIEAIAEVKYYPGATRIGLLLLPGDRKDTVAVRNAALAALQRMGPCAVEPLIPLLKGGRQKQWTAYAIRQITGQPFGSKSAKEIRKWCEVHAPPDACE